MDHSLVTTVFEIDGYRVSKNLGIVKGITVRSRGAIPSFAAGLQTIFGGNITIFTDLAEKARDEAYELMIAHAQQLGANAVIGMRYDATEMAQGITEILCYGTAVVLNKS